MGVRMTWSPDAVHAGIAGCGHGVGQVVRMKTVIADYGNTETE